MSSSPALPSRTAHVRSDSETIPDQPAETRSPRCFRAWSPTATALPNVRRSCDKASHRPGRPSRLITDVFRSRYAQTSSSTPVSRPFSGGVVRTACQSSSSRRAYRLPHRHARPPTRRLPLYPFRADLSAAWPRSSGPY
jgi:hypothetical protein